MVTYTSDTKKHEAYHAVLENFRERWNDPALSTMPDVIVEAAVRYIIDLPNNWEFTVHSRAALFDANCQAWLAIAAHVLTIETAEWDDLDESGESASKARIEEVMSYVDDKNLPEDLYG